MKQRITALLLAALWLFSAVGCAKTAQNPFDAARREVVLDGLTLPLTTAFSETAAEGYIACYQSATVAVVVRREAFVQSAGSADLSLQAYSRQVLEANAAHNPTQGAPAGDYPTMEYRVENTAGQVTYVYYTAMAKSSTAFWLVQFACAEDLYDLYAADFADTAARMTVS